MKKTYFIQKGIAILIAIFLCNSSIYAQFSGGTGTAADPYQLATPADILAMSNFGTSWQSYKLTANIDMAGQTFVAIRTNNTQSFQGDLDGDGYIISNLIIPSHNTTAGRVGFVRKLQGTIINLGFENVTVDGGAYSKVGVIAGEMQNNANFFIKNCYATGDSVKGQNFVGGLVGIAYGNNVIENCFADITVSGTGWTTGGLVGRMIGDVTNCAFYGRATSTIAANWGFPIADPNTAALTCTNCFYIDTFGGSQTNTGATALTAAQLLDAVNYTGFDFTTPFWKILAGNYAVLDFYPTALPVLFSGGTGTAIDPYQIATVADLLAMQNGNSWVYYIMTADIDMAGQTFTSLHSDGVKAFQANFNGKGYVISNLSITPDSTQTTQIGFTQKLQGHIDSVGFENLTVTADTTMNFVGGIAGQLQNNVNFKITNCYILGGSITGGNFVGGMVGIGYVDNSIENCFADVDVVSINSANGWKIGGIAGKFNGPVTTSAFYGTVTTPVAANWGYPIAELDTQTLANCYYADDFGGNQMNAGATALDSAQLTMQASYAGFDFATPVWKMWTDNYAVLDFYRIPPPTFSGGTGSALDPYIISTVADLHAMQGGPNWVNYIMANDIDMAGETFTPLKSNGVNAYQANLNGKGYVISNLTVTPAAGQTNQIGFTRKLQGAIDSLGFANLTVTADTTMNLVGGIAGEMQNNANFKITNCYIKDGTITGGNFVGGLVGIGYVNNTIENCFADVDVVSINSANGWKVGGLAGEYRGPILTSAFYGTVTAPVAANWGYPIAELDTQTLVNCYYAGDFGGNQTNAGATALDSAQLTMQASYAGFDFPTPVWKMWVDNYAVLNFFPIPPPPLPTFSGGSGTDVDPYIISTVQDMHDMQNGSSWVHYIMINDIDMIGETYTPLHSMGVNAYQANFNGKGHLITNLSITPEVGQMSQVGFTRKLQGHIDSLGFENLTVTADTSMTFIGGIAGEIQNNADFKITNCYILGGTITGGDYVGGMVGIGYVDNIIENCFADVDVVSINSASGWKIGGIAGKYNGPILTSAFYGTVTAPVAVDWGYPIAELDTQTLTDCYYADDFGGNQMNAGATALDSAQLTLQASYVGFDFTAPVWKMWPDKYAVLTFTPVTTVSIDYVDHAVEMKVYPNPTEGVVYLEIAKDAKVIVTNTLGIQLKFQDVYSGTNRLDLSQVPAGHYFITVIEGNNRGIKHIVVR